MSNNFFEALHQIATEKGIPREEIEAIVESAMLSAFKKQYGLVDNVKVHFDRENNNVFVVSKRMVVNRPTNPAEEISFDKAKRIDTAVKLGMRFSSRKIPWSPSGGSRRRRRNRSLSRKSRKRKRI